MTRAYYNEIDPFAVEWLKVLIFTGAIAPGDIDDRSIEDVKPNDLIGYTQCHFFAGIGGWSHALRLAGWPDSRPVWTLSCPCQPFSAAGKGDGFADERHLWPAAHWLIAARRPVTLFGEQVASKDGLAWFDTVYADLERTGYATGVSDLCAAGIGAPHIRQRLYFRANSGYCGVGHAASSRYFGEIGDTEGHPRNETRLLMPGSDGQIGNGVGTGANAANCDGRSGERAEETRAREIGEWRGRLTSDSSPVERVESLDTRLQERAVRPWHDSQSGWLDSDTCRSIAASGATGGFWSDAEWWHGRDEKYRPIESGVFPLAHGVPGRVGKLRGFGNAIVPPLAAEFIQASEEITL